MKLEVNNLSVALARQNILKNITLTAQPKEFIGIIGPNGSGKSTLLKCIYRICPVTSGEIYLNGNDIFCLSHKALFSQMAVMSQFQHTDFDFSVWDMVAMGLIPTGKSPIKEEHTIEKALKTVGLLGKRKQGYLSLSGGERQRCVLARIIVQNPKILILDEPTNHLDIYYQIELLEIIKSLDITVVAALHDLSLASQYCDRIYALKNGRLEFEGATNQVLSSHNIHHLFDVGCVVFPSFKRAGVGIEYFAH